MMNQFYQQQSPLLPRRATEPVTLAPTASMIDPNLENHRIQQHTHLPPNYARLQMQHNVVAINGQSNGFHPSHIHHNSNSSSSERSLPSTDVSDITIDDAYVQFIMYCNPSISLEVDTTELRKGFRNPPKSDGKSFSPFKIYELISRLENDLKTWTQLVIELGVERPDAAKNQSSQKVQQYAVRLKRWLKVFHVDAFFNYLHSKPSAYITVRPTSDESLAETVRDTIPAEEDLAIRALLPEWRPKRGRRKAEDVEVEVEVNGAKRQHLRSSSAEFSSMFEEQYSAAPTSAVPWSAQPTQADPWAAAQVAIAPKTPSTGQTLIGNQLSAQVGQQVRWRFTSSNETPSSPYPQSAITPRHPFSATPAFDEPKSAHPFTTSKSPSRARRRHGPAVSSAWPSSSNTSSGKLRGRPPSNRSVQDGPFSTFPANPNSKDTASLSVGTPTQGSPSPSRENTPGTQPSITFSQAPTLGDPALLQKRSKLQLQVPEHSGGPVRLATPPRVLINGESNRQVSHTHERRSSADFFNQLDEVSEEDGLEDGDDEEPNVDWKKRALTLKRKLMEKEEELRLMKRRVLDAVM